MDLNIIIEEDGVRDTDQILKKKLSECQSRGLFTVAVSVVVDLQISCDIPEAPKITHVEHCYLAVHTRLTAKCTEPIQLHKLKKSKFYPQYDLIALEPQNGKMLQYITTGSAELDILTLNLGSRIDFSLLKPNYRTIENRGVCVELNYGPMQLGSSIRRHIITNGQNLIEKANRNLILSSGIKDWFRIRGPKDAIAVGSLFMITQNQCFEAAYKTAEKAIKLSKHKKNPAVFEAIVTDE